MEIFLFSHVESSKYLILEQEGSVIADPSSDFLRYLLYNSSWKTCCRRCSEFDVKNTIDFDQAKILIQNCLKKYVLMWSVLRIWKISVSQIPQQLQRLTG